MFKSTLIFVTLSVACGAATSQVSGRPHTDPAHMGHGAQAPFTSTAQRQAEVALRGVDVMPFNLAATTHIFTKTKQGGVQQVVVKNADDKEQIRLTREHLQEIQQQFLRGDFSGPTRIHGADMPGLAELRSASPGQLAVTYRDIEGGAELSYQAKGPDLSSALHRWFDAQLADHGHDAIEGHAGHGMHGSHGSHGHSR